MTTKQREEKARKTYRKLRALLDPNIANIIEHPDEDPDILRKGIPGRVRTRILPVKTEMRPKGFWRKTKCYYEILVRPWNPELGSCLGAVHFFCYANQVTRGGKTFTPAVSAILKKVSSTAPRGFILSLPDKVTPKFRFARHYYASDFKSYPCDAAAKDLAWLITATLPLFQAIP